jgi:hypothetical protein
MTAQLLGALVGCFARQAPLLGCSEKSPRQARAGITMIT